MAKLDQATENPNDKLPPGKPLAPDEIVQEDFSDEEGEQSEQDKHGIEKSNDLTTP